MLKRAPHHDIGEGFDRLGITLSLDLLSKIRSIPAKVDWCFKLLPIRLNIR